MSAVSTPPIQPLDPPPVFPETPFGYQPCQFEDGPAPCYWDGGTMGNGQGDSYVIHADGTVEYTLIPPIDIEPGEPAVPVPANPGPSPNGPDMLADTGPAEVGLLLLAAVVLTVVGAVLRLRRPAFTM